MSKLAPAPSTSERNSLKIFSPESKGPQDQAVRPTVEGLGNDKNFQNAVKKILSQNPDSANALKTFKDELKNKFGSFEAALEHGSPEQFQAIIQSTDGLVKFEKALMKEITGENKISNEKPEGWLIQAKPDTTETPRRNELKVLSAPVLAA